MSLSISIGEHFEFFIDELISSGKFSSTDEVVKAALILLQDQELKKESLINAILVGEKSGFDKNFDPHAHLKKLKSHLSE